MRKSEIVVVEDEGRDKGRHFLLTEMPASKAERWAIRVTMALAKSGVDVGPTGGGMANLAIAGLRALGALSWEDAQPLLDEMFECVKAIPDPKGRPDFTRALVEDDIEEIATRVFLRAKVFDLHTGFSSAGSLSRSASTTAPARADSTHIRTSHGRSGP